MALKRFNKIVQKLFKINQTWGNDDAVKVTKKKIASDVENYIFANLEVNFLSVMIIQNKLERLSIKNIYSLV
jgi:hypothetical protein